MEQFSSNIKHSSVVKKKKKKKKGKQNATTGLILDIPGI
jgi:hypothetical protein